jgi:hypothetical protein
MAEPRKVGGSAGNRGKGRKKGVPNKVTGALKEMILGALDDAGGRAYLKTQATENPAAFMTLVGKVLPMTVAGDADNPLVITAIERRVVNAQH